MRRIQRWCVLAIAGLATLVPGRAYSVFTHEQLIDLTWNSSIRPLLLRRYPGLTEQQLNRAHSYAYGGCAIHDLGYYPFGKEFFSDLTHYVRTGDFVSSLLRNARNANEYGFALGALSHYVGDTIGHQYGINPATSFEFPALAARYGPSVTYDEDPHAHVQTEFGFDIEQLSKHRLAPSAYLQFIGLRVSRDLLERAFFETYALHVREVLGLKRPTFRTYRWAVRSFLPRIAYAEAVLHRKGFTAEATVDVLKTYEGHLAQADFQTVWNQYRKKPGFRTYVVAIVLRVAPKVGPLALADIRIPGPRTDDLYLASVNRAVADFERRLRELAGDAGQVDLGPNRDLDTGRTSRPGEYPLTDQTYAKLLAALQERTDRQIPEALRSEVVAYFADPQAAEHLHLSRKDRQHLAERLSELRGR